jgi:hypothetical protein
VTKDLLKEGPMVTPDALHGRIVALFDGRPSSGWPARGPQQGLPNYLLYPAVLLGLFWVFAPPFFSLLGLWNYARDWSRPEARFALVLCVISLVFFCCYFYQGTRFMAAPASVLLAGGAAQVARWSAGNKASNPRGNRSISDHMKLRSRRVRGGVLTEA